MNILAFTKKGVAPDVSKLLRSAIENANFLSSEKGLDVDVDNLYVKHAVANDGPRMKRIRPAPMGRAYRYQRRMAHLEIVLAERGRQNGEGTATVVGEEEAATARRQPRPAAKKRAARPARKKTARAKR